MKVVDPTMGGIKMLTSPSSSCTEQDNNKDQWTNE